MKNINFNFFWSHLLSPHHPMKVFAMPKTISNQNLVKKYIFEYSVSKHVIPIVPCLKGNEV